MSPTQRRLTINGLAALINTLAGFAFAWFGYAGYPPAVNRLIWGGFSILLFAYWIGTMAVAFATRNGPMRDWTRARNILEAGVFLGVNGVTFLFMPYGTPELQLVTLLFSSSYCAATILSAADNDLLIRSRILIVMGGLAAVCVWERVPLWPFLTAYIIILTAVLLTFHGLVQRTFTSLRKARVEAEAGRDARTRFLQAATHDFGQPLQAARLFHEQAVRAQSPQHREAATLAARAAFESMERLLNAILDHLRLSSDATVARRDRIEVAPLFLKLAAQYGVAAGADGIDLGVLPTRAAVIGDPHLCERVIGNFIDNAIRHSSAQRVRIGARRSPPDRFRLFVIDDGVGLGDGATASLFDDYVQGAVRGEGGFGLGLASAARAARAMGGSVGIEPRWRGGTQFFLELPATP